MLPLHVRIRDLLAAMLTVDKVIYHPRLQRARAEQSHQRDHIFEAVRLQAFNQIFHAARFKLEDRGGFRALQHVEAFLVIQGDGGDIQRPFAVLLTALVDHLQRPVNDSERTQTEEVEFHQPGVFHVVLVKLGNRMQPLLIAIQWRKVGDFSGSDNHPTGVFTGVSRHPFQLTRHVDQRFHFLVRLVDLRQLRLGLEGFRQRHARIGRHQLGDTIDEAVRVTQHATDIADDRFRRHGTEGDDLRYRVAAVHIRHVLNNLVAFLHAEVDVEVGHRDTFRVKETFEQQVELQRVKIGDLQRVGHQRTGAGTASRANRHAVILRPLDKLHHNQEVAREPHLVDNLEFNIQTLVILRALFSTDGRIREEEFQPLFQTLFRFHDQEIFRGHIAGRELRQEIFAKPHGDVAALGNFNAVRQRFRNIGEQLAHLFLAAHILLRRVVARPFRVVERKAVVDRDADFMGVEIAGVEKADIVGRHHRQAARFRQRHGGVEIGLFILSTGTDQLQKIAVREMLFVEGDALFNQRHIAADQADADVTFPAAGEQNQPFLMFHQPVAIDPRPQGAVAALIGTGNQQGQVLVAGVVRRQHGQLGKFVAEQVALHVKVGADDRLNPRAVSRPVELHQSAEVGEIGDRQRWHAKRGRLLHQRPGLCQPIDHGIVAVHPQVYETWFSHL